VDVRRPKVGQLEAASRNIHRHYDLSNEMFARFLDPTMTYSSALFSQDALSGRDGVADQAATLQHAQIAKIDAMLDLAGVRQGTNLVEIGSGWGSLAIRAAQERAARVTTLTLSAEQQALARQRIADAGMSDLVDVRLEDYRTHAQVNHRRYDAAVSVEMIEAIGERQWPTYFRAIENMLRPHGSVAVQAITMDHRRLKATSGGYTWIHKYIFPGWQLPSVPAIDHTVRRHTRLRIRTARRIGPSYTTTLQIWRHTFNRSAAAVAALGFDETFRRIWNFYLAYCEAGFASHYLDDWQLGMRLD
jgi:cyclopropane-fatty-acyl-phospholipid synthase